MSAADVMVLVRSLPAEEVIDLGRMVDEWTADMVDQKFEVAVNDGVFDAMAADALREFQAGATVPLNEVLDDAHIS